MIDITELVTRYLETWNQTDPAARRAQIDEIWAADGTYVDPMAVAAGRDAIDATVGAVQAQFPGLVFTLAGRVDAHHNLARFTWHLGAPDAPDAPLAIGFDVLVLAADGRRIREVHGFLDMVPAAAAPRA